MYLRLIIAITYPNLYIYHVICIKTALAQEEANSSWSSQNRIKIKCEHIKTSMECNRCAPDKCGAHA